MASPENIYTSNIIWTQNVIFKNIHAYTCKNAIISKKKNKEEDGFKQSLEYTWEILEGGNGREKCKYTKILKINKNSLILYVMCSDYSYHLCPHCHFPPN